MIFVLYAVALLLLAAIPALLVVRNLPLFHGPPPAQRGQGNEPQTEAISVLIPARDEAEGIAAAIYSVLQNSTTKLEVIVMDDHSSDATAEVVAGIARSDQRVRILSAPPLPEGWNGKQHACWQLASQARYETLLFMDADVRLRGDALARLVAARETRQVALLSGFPRQLTASLAEEIMLPLMYFVLLGYLPLDQMRANPKPEFGAGCGQLFLTTKRDYTAAGGHAAIRASRHDGLLLPRRFRMAGLTTDVLDASEIASVRMYRGGAEVVRGLLKNATEGIANSKLIGLFTLLLLGAGVLPLFSLAHALTYGWSLAASGLLVLATLLSYLPRILLARRFQHSAASVLLHPLAVGIFVALQWWAYLRAVCGQPAPHWKGRG
ncbi:MAG: glycosyltransferase [Planctomycetales bacterium]|nr:glycosyltransferase [Planctomycetales bacterium]